MSHDGGGRHTLSEYNIHRAALTELICDLLSIHARLDPSATHHITGTHRGHAAREQQEARIESRHAAGFHERELREWPPVDRSVVVTSAHAEQDL